MGFDGAAYYNLPSSSQASSSTSSHKLGNDAVLERARILAAARRGGNNHHSANTAAGGRGGSHSTGRGIINRPATSVSGSVPYNQPNAAFNPMYPNYSLPPNPGPYQYYNQPSPQVLQPNWNPAWQQSQFPPTAGLLQRPQHPLPSKPNTTNAGFDQAWQHQSQNPSWPPPVQASAQAPLPLLKRQEAAESPKMPFYQNTQDAPRQPLPPQSASMPASSSGSRPYCQVCDMTLPSTVHLIAHRQNQHVKCCKSGEGCTFEAIPRIVEIHEQDRHLIFKPGHKPERTKPDGPLNARIQGTSIKLDTEEDIAKWIEERKRKYPSARNSELREERAAKRRAYEEASPANVWHSNASPRQSNNRGRQRGRGQDRSSFGRAALAGQCARSSDKGWQRAAATAEQAEDGHQTSSEATKDPVTIEAVTNHDKDKEKGERSEAEESNSDYEDEEAAYVAAQLLQSHKVPVPARTAELAISPKHESLSTLKDVQVEEGSDEDENEAPDEQTTKRPTDTCGDDTYALSEDDVIVDPSDALVGGKELMSDAHLADMEGRPSRKAPEPTKEKCRRWSTTGSCKFGNKCKYLHDLADKPRPKSHPAAPPANPFERGNLVGKLLHNEIKHEISDLVQVIDFLARNNFLKNVELYPGQKKEMEQKIQVLEPKFDNEES